MLDSEITVILFGGILMHLIFTQSFRGDKKAIIALNELPVPTTWWVVWMNSIAPFKSGKTNKQNTPDMVFWATFYLFFNNKNINIFVF